jgi:hypothetical protein
MGWVLTACVFFVKYMKTKNLFLFFTFDFYSNTQRIKIRPSLKTLSIFDMFIFTLR